MYNCILINHKQFRSSQWRNICTHFGVLFVHIQGAPGIPPSYVSATEPYHREPSKGIQLYEQPGAQQTAEDGVGRPLPHRTAQQQATGEAQYIDDIPKRTGERSFG